MYILLIVIKLCAFVQINILVYHIEIYFNVFAGASVYVCLNSGRRLVAYEAYFRIFNAILAPLRALFAQCLRVQTPT
jgi:hypothetical protein